MYVIIGRSLRQRVSLTTYVFVVYGMAGFVLFALALASGYALFGYPTMAYLWFFLLALIPQLLGHSSYNYALGFLPAAIVSITLLGEPIGSTILAYIFLGEIPTLLTAIGAVLILTGIFIASVSDIKSSASAESNTHNDHPYVPREK